MPSATATAETAKRADGVRDTIDSIIVALILAFVFRAFIVEAFIIPTGSMGPTLYGAHIEHRCRNCGYTYAVGVREDDLHESFVVICPNCAYALDRIETRGRPRPTSAGDRILVHKWPFDISMERLGPQRWDVIVFKDPKDGKQNYIKRLIGMPQQVLEILDGDIYAASASAVPESLRAALLRPPAPGHARALPEADRSALDRALRIQRKPRSAQESLWMLHYDHDYPPLERHGDAPAWEEAGGPEPSGWNAQTPVVTFDGRSGEHALALTGKPIRDFFAYNREMLNAIGMQQLRTVGDVRLRFVLTPRGRSGELAMLLTKREDEFRATLHADGRVTLAHRGDPRRRMRELASAHSDAISPGRPVHVEFENVDYRVTLRINGRTVLATTDAQYAPDPGRLRGLRDGEGRPPRVALIASGLPLDARHLAVHRDVYYRSVAGDAGGGLFQENSVPGWGTPGRPIYLRADEFFVCGDNSPASKDSRMWTASEAAEFLRGRGEAYQAGTVPRDQLIGQAFFVYWPAGHRLGEYGLPVIPNVGRMRIIR